jgi:hypothetical protein
VYISLYVLCISHMRLPHVGALGSASATWRMGLAALCMDGGKKVGGIVESFKRVKGPLGTLVFLSWQFISLPEIIARPAVPSLAPTVLYPDMDMAEGSSTVGQEPGPSNILAALNTLLLSSSPKSSAYAHPFAPAQNYGSWKGKAKESSHGVELEEQKKLLEQLGQGIASATAIIGRAARQEGKTKLGRGMKEV